MELFEFTLGTTRLIIAANNEKSALKKAIKAEPSFAYLPVNISKIEVPGYDILVAKSKPSVVADESVEDPEDEE
jgi:hypothetical protein